MDRTKAPTEISEIYVIFKSLDWASPENSRFLHISRVLGSSYLPEGFEPYEWQAVRELIDYSTKAKPATRQICQLLRSDLELSRPFRGFVALIMEGRLARGKQSKPTLKDRDLWVYLAISYVEESSPKKYPRERLYEAMIRHIGIDRTAVKTAFTKGEGIFKLFDAQRQKLLKFQFIPRYLETPKHGQFDIASNRLVY